MTHIGPEIEEIRVEPIELPTVTEDEPDPEYATPEPTPALAPAAY